MTTPAPTPASRVMRGWWTLWRARIGILVVVAIPLLLLMKYCLGPGELADLEERRERLEHFNEAVAELIAQPEPADKPSFWDKQTRWLQNVHDRTTSLAEDMSKAAAAESGSRRSRAVQSLRMQHSRLCESLRSEATQFHTKSPAVQGRQDAVATLVAELAAEP